MTIYVDDMYKYPAGKFRRMKMSHMIADTEEELHAIADTIGVARKWYQDDHYDICLSKRALAVRHGAREITWRELGSMMRERRQTMARGRPPKKSTAAVNLSAAIDFVSVAQKDQGAAYETHCAIFQKWMMAFNGVLAAGCKIEEEIECCPRTTMLQNAIDRSGKTLSLTHKQENNRLVIKSDKFTATIPCVPFDQMTPIMPDAPVALINDNLRTGFETIGHLATENSEHVATASILLRSGSMLTTDRKVIMEFWHGIDLPTIVLPKSFVSALLKTKKKLVRFGFSEGSATFYFEDESWLKTQLYNEAWPEVDHILNKAPNTEEVPKDFFEALGMIDPFTETRLAYFRDGVIASHPDENEGVEYECKIPGNMAYNVKSLRHLEKSINAIDFNIGNEENPMAYFYGENLRGAIAGTRYIHDSVKTFADQVPSEGWSTGPVEPDGNDEQTREGLSPGFDPNNPPQDDIPDFIRNSVPMPQRGTQPPPETQQQPEWTPPPGEPDDIPY